MDNPIIYQVIFGLLFLFFCYVTYMVTRTWRWPHVTVAFFLFVTAIAFCYYAARTNATHLAWKQAYQELTQSLRQETVARDKLLHGDRKAVIQDEDSIRSLQAALGRTLLDRGRVWRNCTPTQATPNAVTLNTAPPGATDAPPNRIDEGLVLYAFVEEVLPAEFLEQFDELELSEGAKVPWFYVAEFTVSAATDNSVTLQWTTPPGEYETWVIENMGGRTWVLYETMPVDGHRYFAMDLSQEPSLSKDANDEPVFGEMDEELIKKLFEQHQGLVGEDWNGMVAPYLRDGKRAQDSDPADNKWLRVRFTQNHEMNVDSVGDPMGAVTENELFFSSDGLATAPLVRRGGAAEFKSGDWAVFRTPDATSLVNDGICEAQEQVYVRDVVSYDLALRSTRQQIDALKLDQQRVRRNTAALTESDRRTRQQTSFRRTEQEKLEEDLAKIQFETEKITALASQLQQLKKERMAELSRLFQRNLQLEAALERIERELTSRARPGAAPQALAATSGD